MITQQIIQDISLVAQAQLDLKKRLKIAMQSVYQHPALNDEYEQFLVSVLAVYLISSSEEQKIIKTHIEALADICKFIESCEQGLSTPFPSLEIPDERLGLLTLWNSTKGEMNVITQSQCQQPH